MKFDFGAFDVEGYPDDKLAETWAQYQYWLHLQEKRANANTGDKVAL